VRASLDALLARPEVDAGRIGAIGFCMGGTFVLELARSGAPVAGVVTFHGLLEAKRAAQAGEMKAKVLVCNGADDPFVPQAAIDGFTAEMKAAEVEWQIVNYPGAKHSFTNPQAGNYNRPGLAYDQHADTHSWTAMTRFFADLFA
jgi:dienelactone hydrolase